MNRPIIVSITFALLLSACGGDNNIHDIGVRLIGEQTTANALKVDGTAVGGLSGISYNPSTDTWVILSDDRSDKNPARFYTARLKYDASTFSPVEWLRSTSLQQPDGTTYPNRASTIPNKQVPDPEAIRIDPDNGSIWWTSEGDRALSLDPFVMRADASGRAVASLPLPTAFKMPATTPTGSRNNATFEGLTFSADGKTVWAGMEAPLYQDGPLPTPTTGAYSRLLQYDRNGNVIRQAAYPIDPIPATPGAGKNADNGLSELLAIDANRFLVLERAGVQGSDDAYKMHIRLFEIDTRSASDVSNIASLATGQFTPVRKRLVLNLNTLGLRTVDNIEGMAWGPRLANGSRSLVMVSDNNFSDAQTTQFLAFEVTSE